MNTMTDLLAAQKCALEAAELASIEIIKAYYSSVSEYDTKSTDMDLVTKTDVLCQSIIIEHLKAFNNNFKFIAEEIEGEIVLDDTPTWIIDPIDGTTNFVHRYPFVAVAICLAINKQPTVGVVVCPILGEKYTAIRGQGAFKFDAHSPQSRPISSSPIVDISKSIISTNYSYDRTDTGINSVNKRLYELLVRKVHGVRVTGSGVINIVHVAAGQSQAFFEEGPLHIWDMAAAMVILQEAGGVMLDLYGKEVDLLSRRCLAACNQTMAESLVSLFK